MVALYISFVKDKAAIFRPRKIATLVSISNILGFAWTYPEIYFFIVMYLVIFFNLNTTVL